MTQKRALWVGLGFLLMLALSACGGETGGGENGGEENRGEENDNQENQVTGEGSWSCESDADLIADLETNRISCIRDEHCPCGSSCWLGLCQASCTSGEDCGAGEYCDSFGQCRDEGDDEMVALTDRHNQGRLQPRSKQVTLNETRPTTSFLVRALDGPVAVARVAAGEGIEVAVTDGEAPDVVDYRDQAMIDTPIEEEDTVTIWTRRVPAPEYDEEIASEITIWDSSGNRSTVSVAGIDSPIEIPEISGNYTGVALLIERGSIGGVGRNLSVPQREKSVPITAQIIDADGASRIAFYDELRVLHPGGEWVGTLSADGASLNLPAFSALDLTQIARSNTQVIASPENIRIEGNPTTEDWDGVLRFGIDLAYHGISDTADVPTSRWVISISRTGDLPEDTTAPDPQAPAELAIETSLLANTEFVAESGMASLAGNFASQFDRFEAIRAVGDRALGSGDITQCLEPYLPLESYEERDGYYKSFNNSIFADALANNVLSQNGTLENNSFRARPVHQPSNGQTKTIAEIVAMNLPMVSEIFAGISGQDDVVWSAQTSMGSGFFQREPTSGHLFDYAPPLTFSGGTVINHALPCDIDFRDSPDILNFAQSDSGRTLDVPNQRFDFCQAAADRLDCEIIDVTTMLTDEERLLYPDTSSPNDFNVEINVGGAGFFDREFLTIPNTRFTKVCIPPTIPARCAEGLACENASSSAGGFITLSDNNQSASSGDLGCGSSGRNAALEMDEVGLPANTLVEDCITDSLALENILGTPSGDTERERLASMGWYDSAGCFKPIQMLGTIGRSTETLRFWRQQNDRETTIADLLAMRMLQRWTDAHTLIANEAANGSPFAHLEGSGATIDDLEAQLDISLRAWRLLMHPRVGTAIFSLSPDALRAPDYRRLVQGAAFSDASHHRQAAGLVVAMNELLQAQLQLGAAIAERYAFEGSTTVPESLIELTQLELVAESMIHALAERSRDVDGSYGQWNDQLRSVERRSMSSWIQLTNRFDDMLNDRNPLGIEDTDLPLYFKEIFNDAVSRFGATTSFLLGQTNDSEAWAASLVRSASTAYETAKDAYHAESARLLNEAASESDKAIRTDVLVSDFGLMMTDMCGSDAFGGASYGQVWDSINSTFDVSTCWYRGERNECTSAGASGGQSDRDRQIDTALYSLCTDSLSSPGPNGLGERKVLGLVEREGVDFRYYADIPGWEFSNPVLARFQTLLYSTWISFPGTVDASMRLASAACAADDGGTTICAPNESFQSIPVIHNPDTGAPLNPCVNEDVPNFPGFLPAIEAQPDGSLEAVCASNSDKGFEGPTLRVALDSDDLVWSSGSESDAPSARSVERRCRAFIPSFESTPIAAWAQAPESCYTGSVGAEVFATRTLVTDIELARDQLHQSSDAYGIAMQSCFLQQRANQAITNAQNAFNLEMNRLSTVKQIADTAATWAYSTSDCLATVSGAGAPWQFAVSGGSCAATAYGSAADTVSIAMEADMERAERGHESTILAIEQAVDDARCFKEAELELVGVRSAHLEITRAQQELSASYLEVKNTLDNLRAEYEAGRDDIVWSESTAVLVPSRSPWFSEELNDYTRKLRLARRGAYLAVRAVEYEFQMSSSYRYDVLTAETPLELEQVLTELRQIANTNSVGGSRPAELTEVVSLKDHLLQLGDRRESAPEGWHSLSSTERFRKMLVDPSFEVYEQGVFAGRLIPFDIAPLSVLDRGSFEGVPVVSDNSCAERLWSLNVTIQGDEEKMFGGITPTSNLEIRKRNTFYSNFCSAADEDFQVASIRPSRNLFREPGAGEGISGITGASEADGYSKARIQARLNVPARDFSSNTFTDGASTELAARGLFGDYAIFIPATSLASTSDGQPTSDGLVLNQVDDILLRIDYVSVAR